jgi:import inner membrane translocase subunit TIM8|tara:strand:- start:4920 stop:5150 length:231 start_codon:yes stop_codon:yes gene_type:complete|eukprot:CAMPEP_0119211742 /NCGR_PEP_ID=MMETSP1327-20130426/3146_1 /TAXON_ID=38833 /ORGANISM="Micromonas pusilla, Strain RCC2306" /LENGTH=76 /DNA_ID=CAMNT_0007208897 /DNA_START=70 /DNA_END=300 /DNA_ORIENTATION=-
MAQPGVTPEMANFLEEEKRKAMFNEVVSKLADVCFDKCVSKPGSSLDRYETACLSQCALRYLETGQVIMGRIQRMQ